MNILIEAKIKAAEEVARRTVISSYSKYVEYVHEGRWYPGKHVVYLCTEIQKFIETSTGHPYDIMIIQMPPQHGKSMSTTETLPSWYMGRNPQHRVILASYNDNTAERFTRRNKEKIRKFGKPLFDIEISKTIDRSTEFELINNVGRMMSAGIMGGITSNPANLIIIDDPIKNRQEADSETYRERVWEEWQNSIKSRLAAAAKIIVIMTRWHEDDLAGRLINYESNVEVINLPCEAEETDAIGRNVGDSLFPEIGKDNNWLRQFKVDYINDPTGGGLRAWNALYQGRPTSQEGSMIKRHWWRYWKPKGMDLPPVTVKMPDGSFENIVAIDLPDSFDEQLQSWDCTFKDNKDNDMVSGGVLGRKDANCFVFDLINERMDIIKTMDAIQKFTAKYPKALTKLIEDKANGPAVIQMLKHKIPGMLAVNPEGGKAARASAVSPVIESGNVYLPHPLIYAWVNTIIDQFAAFPNGANDDIVDMITQALNKLMYHYMEKVSRPLPKGFYTKGELEDMGYKKMEIKKVK